MFAVFFYFALLSILRKTSYQIVCEKFCAKNCGKTGNVWNSQQNLWRSDHIYLIFVCSVSLFCIFYGLIEVWNEGV